MIEAVALRGVLTLWYEGRKADINLEGARLANVIRYIEAKTGKKVNLIAGQLGK